MNPACSSSHRKTGDISTFKVEEMAVGVQSECQEAFQPLFPLSQDQIKASAVPALSADKSPIETPLVHLYYMITLEPWVVVAPQLHRRSTQGQA
jgi:hypothetical protein